MISKKPALGLDPRVATGFSLAIKCTQIAYAYLNQVFADCECLSQSSVRGLRIPISIECMRIPQTYLRSMLNFINGEPDSRFGLIQSERMQVFDCNSRRTNGRRADMQRFENTGLRWRPAMRCRIWLHATYRGAAPSD